MRQQINVFFNWVNIYTVSALLYLFLFSIGSNIILIRLSYAWYYGLSFYFFIKAILLKSKSLTLSWNLFFLVLVFVYGSILVVTGSDGTWKMYANKESFLQWHIASVIPAFAFYYLCVKYEISVNWFIRWTPFFMIVAFSLYNHERLVALSTVDYFDGEITNNSGYLFASFFPIVALFRKRPVLQYLLLGLVSVMVLLCFKRGAIIVSFFSILAILMINVKRKDIFSSSAFSIFLGVCLCVLIYYSVNELITTNDYFQFRLDRTLEGDSSGRDEIISEYLSYYFGHLNMSTLFLGYGANATMKIMGLQAHNDWVEYLFDMGLIGVLSYYFYWKNLIKDCFKSKRLCSIEVFSAFICFVIIYFGKALFSMSFMDMNFFSSALLGFLLATVHLESKRAKWE